MMMKVMICSNQVVQALLLQQLAAISCLKKLGLEPHEA
jgi:hypothetical protein